MKYRYTISIHNFRYKKDNQIQQTINSLEHSVVGGSLEQGAGEGRAGHSRVREVGPWSEGLGKSGWEADRITPFPPPRPPGQLWYLLGRPVQKPISSVCQAAGGEQQLLSRAASSATAAALSAPWWQRLVTACNWTFSIRSAVLTGHCQFPFSTRRSGKNWTPDNPTH